MSFYASDGDLYAGWKSVGRWFALTGAGALTIGVIGFSVTHSHSAYRFAASDQMLALAAQWIGTGLGIVMAMAALGSIRISRAERGDVEITDGGVRRIYSPHREEFFPRREIAGFVVRRGGGVTLIDAAGRRQMVVPRSIDGYRDCIAELKAMGIQSLPADRLRQTWATREKTPLDWILFYAIVLAVPWYCERLGSRMIHHAIGISIAALFILQIALEDRRAGKFHWGSWIVGVAVLAAFLDWRW